jgi:hypothetical protein
MATAVKQLISLPVCQRVVTLMDNTDEIQPLIIAVVTQVATR